MKKLILVDDHAMLLTGITAWFQANSDWDVAFQCESFASLKSSLSSASFEEQDCVVAIVDISLKRDDTRQNGESGWDCVVWLRKQQIPSVMFSSHDTGSAIEKAMSAEIGARGFVSKCADEQVLLAAVNAVAEGKTYVQPDLISEFIEIRTILSALTPKEREITDLVLKNFDNEEIAELLEIKLRTVENYLSKIYDKVGVKNKRMLQEMML